jgi:hypothetical protein
VLDAIRAGMLFLGKQLRVTLIQGDLITVYILIAWVVVLILTVSLCCYHYRFKLHVQVMDNTGSTSFIIFDCNVANYVGRSVQDLIDTQGQVI